MFYNQLTNRYQLSINEYSIINDKILNDATNKNISPIRYYLEICKFISDLHIPNVAENIRKAYLNYINCLFPKVSDIKTLFTSYKYCRSYRSDDIDINTQYMLDDINKNGIDSLIATQNHHDKLSHQVPRVELFDNTRIHGKYVKTLILPVSINNLYLSKIGTKFNYEQPRFKAKVDIERPVNFTFDKSLYLPELKNSHMNNAFDIQFAKFKYIPGITPLNFDYNCYHNNNTTWKSMKIKFDKSIKSVLFNALNEFCISVASYYILKTFKDVNIVLNRTQFLNKLR